MIYRESIGADLGDISKCTLDLTQHLPEMKQLLIALEERLAVVVYGFDPPKANAGIIFPPSTNSHSAYERNLNATRTVSRPASSPPVSCKLRQEHELIRCDV